MSTRDEKKLHVRFVCGSKQVVGSFRLSVPQKATKEDIDMRLLQYMKKRELANDESEQLLKRHLPRAAWLGRLLIVTVPCKPNANTYMKYALRSSRTARYMQALLLGGIAAAGWVLWTVRVGARARARERSRRSQRATEPLSASVPVSILEAEGLKTIAMVEQKGWTTMALQERNSYELTGPKREHVRVLDEGFHLRATFDTRIDSINGMLVRLATDLGCRCLLTIDDKTQTELPSCTIRQVWNDMPADVALRTTSDSNVFFAVAAPDIFIVQFALQTTIAHAMFMPPMQHRLLWRPILDPFVAYVRKLKKGIYFILLIFHGVQPSPEQLHAVQTLGFKNNHGQYQLDLQPITE